jgi:hypothetical protein
MAHDDSPRVPLGDRRPRATRHAVAPCRCRRLADDRKISRPMAGWTFREGRENGPSRLSEDRAVMTLISRGRQDSNGIFSTRPVQLGLLISTRSLGTVGPKPPPDGPNSEGNVAYCSDCGTKAVGKFCFECGARVVGRAENDGPDVPARPVPTEEWKDFLLGLPAPKVQRPKASFVQQFAAGFRGDLSPTGEEELLLKTVSPAAQKALLDKRFDVARLSGYLRGRDLPSLAVYLQVAPEAVPGAAFRIAVDPAHPVRTIEAREIASGAGGHEGVMQGLGIGLMAGLAAAAANAAMRAQATWAGEFRFKGGDLLRVQMRRAPHQSDLMRLDARIGGAA